LDGTALYTEQGAVGTDGQVQVGPADVDLYRLEVNSPGGITANVTGTGTNFAPYLRLFNSSGAELDNNYNSSTNTVGPGFLQTHVQPPGVYYIGVSGFKNNGYNISTGAGATPAVGTGTYQLTIGLTNPDPNGVIPGALPYAGLPFSYSGTIG